jgi:hypothetical protein
MQGPKAAPFVAEDSEATESDEKGGNVAGDEIAEKGADTGAEAAASSSGAKNVGDEAETMVPPLG